MCESLCSPSFLNGRREPSPVLRSSFFGCLLVLLFLVIELSIGYVVSQSFRFFTNSGAGAEISMQQLQLWKGQSRGQSMISSG
jgi:hypothetical protein